MNEPIGSLTPEHRIGDWIGVTNGHVAVRSGKVELGQGITAALVGLVAAELGIDPTFVVCVAPTTESPDEGFTAGSLSMSTSGTALRLASRALRRVTATGDGLPVDLASVTTAHLDARVLDVIAEIPTDALVPSMPRRDAPHAYLVSKLTGQPFYVHDLRLPGQIYGRIIRRAGRRPDLAHGSVIDPGKVPDPDVLKIVRDGNFLGVLARTEHAATSAAERMDAAIEWVSAESQVDEETAREEVLDRAPATEDRNHHVRVTRPCLLHASIGPACAIARWDESGSRVEVWTHSQGVHPLRRELARALGLDVSALHVAHVPGAGCYGHNGADDVAYDAVLLARSMPGVPVHVTWSRAQDLSCGPAGPAMEVEVAAETDDTGHIVNWDWYGSGEGHMSRPGSVAGVSLLAHSEILGGSPMPASVDPAPAIGGGITRNSRPLYDVTVRHAESTLRPSNIRTSAIRSLGAYLNVVAIEALMEDIARAHGIDVVEFRLAHLSDERAIQVLLSAVELSGEPSTAEAHGRGIGLARYKGTGAWCAVVADVECIDRVQVNQLIVVADVGEVVSRDGVLHQLEGGAIQSLSWTLHESAPITRGAVNANGWADYPMARFTDVPSVVADVIDRPGEPFLGAGEAAAGPTGAAISNAVTAALGVRITELPLTPKAIMRAIR